MSEQEHPLEDAELQSWIDAWQEDEEAPAAHGAPTVEECERLRHRAQRFGHWLVLGTAVEIASMLAVLLWVGGIAWRNPSAQNLVLLAMVVLLVVVGEGLALWNRRGTWRPRNDSVKAFLDLEHLRQKRQLFTAKWLLPVFLAFELALLLPWKWWQLASNPEVEAVGPVFLKVLGLMIALVVITFLGLTLWAGRVRRRLEEIEELQASLGEGND